MSFDEYVKVLASVNAYVSEPFADAELGKPGPG
jgi:hypothetical protein